MKENCLMCFCLIALFFLVNETVAQETVFKVEDLMTSNRTPTYDEMVFFYEKYANENPRIALYQMGTTDAGKPLLLCVLNALPDSAKTFEKARNSAVLLVNNGIHPGEPCGINASMQLVHEYAYADEQTQKNFPVVGIIPSYNIGGMLNRSSTSRANQNGPEEYGFRGNARNLDLNRDFIKTGSENMVAFATLFHALDPDVFIDTHTSNGADYQYTMTYIAPVKERLPEPIRTIQFENCIPYMEKSLPQKWGYDFFPYVSLKGKTLEDGIYSFNGTPRYAMGYAELFHTISFTTEAHMLKPFPDRVRSTFAVIMELIAWTMSNESEIEAAREKTKKLSWNQSRIGVNYKLSNEATSVDFKGYKWRYEKSGITEQPRLKYFRDSAEVFNLNSFETHVASDSITVPAFYIVRRTEGDIISLLDLNKVEYKYVKNDSLIRAEQCRIQSFESVNKPYEGRFLHFNTQAEWEPVEVVLNSGDVVVPVKQDKATYILAILDPRQPDSFFNWSFMDSYVQQKEYFSPYVFEDIATELLGTNRELREDFRRKQKEDPEFSSNRWEQLYFIYKRSPYFEPTHNLLPIFRVQ